MAALCTEKWLEKKSPKEREDPQGK